MIKFIFAAVWIVAATIGSIYFAFSATGNPESAEDSHTMRGLDYMKTDVLSIPLIREGDVQGYFLARLVFTVEPEKLKALPLPPSVLFIDELYTHLYSNPQIDFSRVDTLDVDTFRNGIREAINLRVGQELIHEVLIEQIDFLSKTEIRDNNVRRRTGG